MASKQDRQDCSYVRYPDSAVRNPDFCRQVEPFPVIPSLASVVDHQAGDSGRLTSGANRR